ncbi:hypothetical protein [Cesiribacter sp. SM1]|uniref:hypothetical protein n=1 Tax=Cesiribacter sp. SM1 TaxID=2861196 RepID=UPI001CD6C83D|nr:hypothetical protein [Cesiribacter sp. SM1]
MKTTILYFNKLALSGVLAFSMFACGEDDVAPQQTAQVNMSFNTVNTSSASAGERVLAGNSLAFTSGFITIREIQFEAESATDSVEVDLEQITVIDFATGISTPDISGLTIPAGTYNEVEVEIELQDDSDEPAVVLNGTYTDANGVKHPVRFEFNSGETFEVEKEGAITFAGGESILAQVTFDPNVWFIEVTDEDLSLAAKDAQGVIVISETQNTDIYESAAEGLDLATEVEISE